MPRSNMITAVEPTAAIGSQRLLALVLLMRWSGLSIKDAARYGEEYPDQVREQLFSIEALTGRVLFKGGTSLSKIFHAINRSSEDIDRCR